MKANFYAVYEGVCKVEVQKYLYGWKFKVYFGGEFIAKSEDVSYKSPELAEAAGRNKAHTFINKKVSA